MGTLDFGRRRYAVTDRGTSSGASLMLPLKLIKTRWQAESVCGRDGRVRFCATKVGWTPGTQEELKHIVAAPAPSRARSVAAVQW